MAGKRPTRPQLRSRRRALNSYLLSTESSYSDLAKQFGVRESTVRNFLGKSTKQVRTSYNSSPGYQKLYNAAARNTHTSDLRKLARQQKERYVPIPPVKREYHAPQVVTYRREAASLPKSEREHAAELFRRATRLQQYTRNVERDYAAVVSRRESQKMDFQQRSFNAGRPIGLQDFLDTDPSKEDIANYIDDVITSYKLNDAQAEAVSERFATILGL